MAFRFWWETEEAVHEAGRENKAQNELTKSTDDSGNVSNSVTGLDENLMEKLLKKKIYFVFQGMQYPNEFADGYIYAGCSSKEASWNRLAEVKKGDIIIHAYQGYIRAISVAKGKCHIAPRPWCHYDMRHPNADKGYRVDTEYKELHFEMQLKKYIPDIVRLQGNHRGKGYPFNKNGTGNQGYLFNMNKNLALMFIQEMTRRDSSIIDWLLSR